MVRPVRPVGAASAPGGPIGVARLTKKLGNSHGSHRLLPPFGKLHRSRRARQALLPGAMNSSCAVGAGEASSRPIRTSAFGQLDEEEFLKQPVYSFTNSPPTCQFCN